MLFLAFAADQVWEEGVSSEPAALRLYAGEISAGLAAMLGGPQWGRKKAAAEALVKLTEVRWRSRVVPFHRESSMHV